MPVCQAPPSGAAMARGSAQQGRSSVVEQRPFKPKVVGSIPTAPTKIFDLQRLIAALGINKAI